MNIDGYVLEHQYSLAAIFSSQAPEEWNILQRQLVTTNRL